MTKKKENRTILNVKKLLMRTILHYYIPRYAMQGTAPVGEIKATEGVEGAGRENVADL